LKTLKDLTGERTLEDFNRVQDGKEENWIEIKKLRQEAIERIKFLERKYPEIKEEKLTFWLDGRKKEINCNIRNSDFIDRIGASAVRQYLMNFFNLTEKDLK